MILINKILLLAVVFLVVSIVLGLDNCVTLAGEPHREYFVSVYYGDKTPHDFLELFKSIPDTNDNHMLGVGLGRELCSFWKYFTFEFEGQFVYHWGHYSPLEGYVSQDFVEFVGAILLRGYLIDQPERWSFSLAIGDGLSWTGAKPHYEVVNKEPAGCQLLNYLTVETELGFPKSPLSLVGRIHHRSSVFGLFCPSTGSNFYTVGLRLDF